MFKNKFRYKLVSFLADISMNNRKQVEMTAWFIGIK